MTTYDGAAPGVARRTVGRDRLTARSAPQHSALLRTVVRIASSLPPGRPPLWTYQYAFSLLGTASFFACFFYLTTTLPREMTDLGFNLFEIGLVVGGYAAIPILLRPFIGRWSDGGHRILQMRFALLAFIASFVLMIFTDNLWALFALRCVQGIGHGGPIRPRPARSSPNWCRRSGVARVWAFSDCRPVSLRRSPPWAAAPSPSLPASTACSFLGP